MEKYRHEYKYLIDERMLRLCEQRIKGICPKDSNAGDAGEYTIRSVYFDDIYDRCYWENENGEDKRYKYRIRIYNGSKENIRLEKKGKHRGMTTKVAVALTYDEANAILKGQMIKMKKEQSLLNEFLIERMNNWLRPVVVVDYDRIPYVYNAGNVRITFDKNISGSQQINGFWNKDMLKCPVLDCGYHILEIKYDEYLPTFIREQLYLDSLRRTSFSKFYYCRRQLREF